MLGDIFIRHHPARKGRHSDSLSAGSPPAELTFVSDPAPPVVCASSLLAVSLPMNSDIRISTRADALSRAGKKVVDSPLSSSQQQQDVLRAGSNMAIFVIKVWDDAWSW